MTQPDGDTAAPVITFVVGARPNFMKTAPVIRALRDRAPETGIRIVHTGQHYDSRMSDVILGDLGFPEPDVWLNVGSGTHAEQTAAALTGIEHDLIGHRPDLVVVPGDVNSTLAAALAAVKLDIPVCHLEAGLRSFDTRMPEEHNRKLTDHVSALLLTHSPSAVENLAREGIEDGVMLVGNTMVDSVLAFVDTARERRPWEQFGLDRGSYALVTLHRPAMVDDITLLSETIGQLASIAEEMPIVFPIHPRTRARITEAGLTATLGRLHACEPLGYLDFLGLEAEARFVLTDSGGVQEETSTLGVRCFTLRDSTERPITVELGTNTVLGTQPERLAKIPVLLETAKHGSRIPLWDGHAGERVAEELLSFVASR